MLVQFIEYDIRAQVQQLTFCDDAGYPRASRRVTASANVAAIDLILLRITTSNEMNFVCPSDQTSKMDFGNTSERTGYKTLSPVGYRHNYCPT